VMVAHARRRLLDAWLSERGWENRMHAACHGLLSGVARAPKGPRLVLVESLGIGPPARERMQLAGQVFERSVATAFSLAPEQVAYPRLTPRVVVTGVRNIVFNRLLERRHRELPELSDEILDWVEAYRMPSGMRLRMLTLTRTPHLPPAPAAFLTTEDKRARVLGSVVHLTLDEGYASLTDPQIAQFAGVSTEAFHRYFRNKEECFLAVLDEFVAETLAAVRPALDDAASWEEAACRATDAFVAHLVAHEALLRLAFIDLFEVGPAMIGRMTRSVADFTAMLTEGAPSPARGPRIAQEAVTGALWGVISTFVSNNRLSRLPALVDHLSFTLLAPYVGARRALEALAETQRRASAA
ncbi:MAG TPA: TetR/AcrR family transcriptional regulator, partial [Polyangiaceae bacterium]|nr:TetR/AcrR family transcriptional regulator [Polyangiaceae bacterium]